MIYVAIINACVLHDAGCLTTAIIAKTIFSCLCSPVVACAWVVVGWTLFVAISKYD